MSAACARCGFDADAVVSARWAFVIPREVLSLNAHRTNAGSRWGQRKYRDDRTAWQQWFMVRHDRESTGAHRRRRVTLTRVMGKGQREFDADNLSGGMKVCVDAMVRAGWLRDDTKQWAEIHYAQERGAVAGLRVLVEELADSTGRDAKAGGA